MTAASATSAVSAMVSMALLLMRDLWRDLGWFGHGAALFRVAGFVRMIRIAAAPSRAPRVLFITSAEACLALANARYWTVSIAAEVSAPPTTASHHRRTGSMRATINPKGIKRRTLAAPSTCM